MGSSYGIAALCRGLMGRDAPIAARRGAAIGVSRPYPDLTSEVIRSFWSLMSVSVTAPVPGIGRQVPEVAVRVARVA